MKDSRSPSKVPIMRDCRSPYRENRASRRKEESRSDKRAPSPREKVDRDVSPGISYSPLKNCRVSPTERDSPALDTKGSSPKVDKRAKRRPRTPSQSPSDVRRTPSPGRVLDPIRSESARSERGERAKTPQRRHLSPERGERAKTPPRRHLSPERGERAKTPPRRHQSAERGERPKSPPMRLRSPDKSERLKTPPKRQPSPGQSLPNQKPESTARRAPVYDAFGFIGKAKSPSPRKEEKRKPRTPSPPHRTIAARVHYSPSRRGASPGRRSPSPSRRGQISPDRGPRSPRRRTPSPKSRRTPSPRRRLNPRRRSPSPRRRGLSPRRRSLSPKRGLSPRRRSPSPRRGLSPRRRSTSPRRGLSPRKRSTSP